MPADESSPAVAPLDDPEVATEVTAAFERYEQALVTNDLATLNELFWNDPRTIRHGIAEGLYGYDEVVAWRNGAEPVPSTRTILRTDVLVIGTDVAVVDIEFRNGDDPTLGRQSQVWVRRPEGWRIARAHVSLRA